MSKFLVLFFLLPFSLHAQTTDIRQALGIVKAKLSCHRDGTGCAGSEECCSGLCSGGVCASDDSMSCSGDGDSCGSSADCCNSDCSDGVCGGTSSCNGPGGGCGGGDDCCSGQCYGGACG